MPVLSTWKSRLIDEVVEEKEKLHHEKMEFLNTIDKVVEEKQKLQQDHHVIKELVAPMEQQLETVKKEFEEAKQEHVAAKQELVSAKEQLAQKNEELEALRKKLLESEAMDTQLEQQHGSAPEPAQFRRVTRSTHKREMLLQGSLGHDADRHCLKKQRSPQLLNNPIVGQHTSRDDDMEVVRQKLIKGFTEIDAGRYLGVKEMGKLNEKPFRDACAKKLPPKQSGARASELYILWQELLNNPNWNPCKTVTVDGNRQEEVIDVDDDKLQELKMAWGEGPYNSVISALVERKEYNSDGTSVFDLWNYREGRKATLGECVKHILDKVEQFKRFRLRTQ